MGVHRGVKRGILKDEEVPHDLKEKGPGVSKTSRESARFQYVPCGTRRGVSVEMNEAPNRTQNHKQPHTPRVCVCTTLSKPHAKCHVGSKAQHRTPNKKGAGRQNFRRVFSLASSLLVEATNGKGKAVHKGINRAALLRRRPKLALTVCKIPLHLALRWLSRSHEEYLTHDTNS